MKIRLLCKYVDAGGDGAPEIPGNVVLDMFLDLPRYSESFLTSCIYVGRNPERMPVLLPAHLQLARNTFKLSCNKLNEI